MGYEGFLIKIKGATDYVVPLTYMKDRSYKAPLSTLDKEAFRNGNGVLKRTAILQVPHSTFETRILPGSQLSSLWQNIRSRYVVALEKKVRATVFVPELNDYYTGYFYVPDIDMIINHIDEKKNIVYYEPVTFEFIGYGEGSA